MSAPAAPPYWVLISILFSSLPLYPALAMRLHQAAYDLYRRDEGVARLQGDLAQGEVRNLRKVLLLGSLSGPGFEALIETEYGSGTVRFLLTHQGLELMAESESAARPTALN
jgi:hypothetical protein